MRRKAAIGPVQSTRVKQAVEKNTGDLQGADVRRIQGKAIEIAKEKARALNRPYREISAGPRSLQNFSRAPRRVLDEEVPLSGIFASLQIQGIYRRFTGNREIRFFGSGVARSVRPGRVRREAIGPWRAQQRAVSVALEQQNAPEAVGLRTRECHSALTAMRRSRRECKRNSIYPRYSGVRGSWPIDASRRAASAGIPRWSSIQLSRVATRDVDGIVAGFAVASGKIRRPMLRFRASFMTRRRARPLR